MKIRIRTDRAGEAFVRTCAWDTAIPLSLVFKDGVLTLTVWRALRRPVSRLLCESGVRRAAALPAALVSELTRLGEAYLVSEGFAPSRRSGRIFDYSGTGRSRILGSTLPLDETVLSCENLTGYDLAATLAAGRRAYVTVAEGQVVSIAAVCEDGEPATCEIGMETSPCAMRRGYAASNVAALARELAEAGHCVTARTEEGNLPSERTLTAAGFSPTGDWMTIIGER